jgi:hypothetical protein
MQSHHLIGTVPNNITHLHVLCPWVEKVLESPVRWLPFSRVCLEITTISMENDFWHAIDYNTN